MTNQERYDYYNGGEFQKKVQMELVDWLSYWTSVGVDIIEDDTLKHQTTVAIQLLMNDLNGMTRKVALLALGEDVIKDAALLPTDENIRTAVTAIMSTRLRWLTGVTE